MSRVRLRDLGITIGRLPTGPHNAITDVPGVLVGHSTIIHDGPRVARTGVTVILPRDGDIWRDFVFAGHYAFNGCGEMTGLLWLEESGTLGTAIALTSTYSVGAAHDALVAYAAENGHPNLLPVVAETHDGWLNDGGGFHVRREHVFAAIASARGGPVAEGNVGGGTGMICHEFKGGIGTASRRAETPGGVYTVGVLVQSNYGERFSLRVDGVPVGREIGPERVPTPWEAMPDGTSIIAVIATDAPLLAAQCKRLARRATVGLARAGGLGQTFSGDIFLAFATGNHLPRYADAPFDVKMLPTHQIDPLLEAAAEATEEAILNALTAAETMTGQRDRVVHALPLDELQRVMARYRSAG